MEPLRSGGQDGSVIRPFLLLALAGWAQPAAALGLQESASLCEAAMDATKAKTSLPAHLLMAIAMVESGRPRPGSGASPWPWTINVAGAGHFYETKSEAIAAVRAAQATGIQSIDVGCMQINLPSHPQAFASLDDAFDPAMNVQYGASFLQRLHVITGDWPAAVAAYHSFTPDRGAEYARRVAVIWPLAAAYVPRGSATAALALTARTHLPEVDPDHVMTPEFRARLVEEAAFRRTRNLGMGVPDQGQETRSPVQAKQVAKQRPSWRRLASDATWQHLSQIPTLMR